MKGDTVVIEHLNKALFLELGAVNQYWLHYRLLDDWGIGKLAAKEREESIEEMQHADKLIARILFLGGHPNMQSLAPLRIGENVREVLDADLAGEIEACVAYKEAREVCEKAGDYVTKICLKNCSAMKKVTSIILKRRSSFSKRLAKRNIAN